MVRHINLDISVLASLILLQCRWVNGVRWVYGTNPLSVVTMPCTRDIDNSLVSSTFDTVRDFVVSIYNTPHGVSEDRAKPLTAY